MNIDELAERHESDHPGYVLTDWYDAAFPTYEVYLRVLVQEKQPLPTIEKFVLRALEAGVDDADEIHRVLGLDYGIVSDALDQLHRSGHITILRTPAGRQGRDIINLTTKGRSLLATLVLLRPREEDFAFCLDALTGEYRQHRSLRTVKSVREFRLHQIPVYLPSPTYEAIDIVSLRRVWKEVRRSLPKADIHKELLDVLALKRAYVGYQPMRVLQFVRPADGAVLVQVYDASERSLWHEAALLKMEDQGLRALRTERLRGPQVSADPIVNVVGAETYEAARRKAAEVPRLQQDIQRIQEQIEEAAELRQATQIPEEKERAEERQKQLEEEKRRLSEEMAELESKAPTVQVLSMAQHRPKLLEMLREAKKQAVIVSPWLTPTAVTCELLKLIASAVARGVEVWIGYGFGEPDYAEEQTLKELKKVRQGKGGQRLHLCRLEDNHAKVLICDERYVITTSFNWLSFAGRADRGNRHETGTLTTDPQAVRAMLDYWMPLLRTAERGSAGGASEPETSFPREHHEPAQLLDLPGGAGALGPQASSGAPERGEPSAE